MSFCIKTNGVTDFTCDGNHWFICYFTADTSYHSHGQHAGQITGIPITVEYFDTESDLNDRIAALGIVIPDEY